MSLTNQARAVALAGVLACLSIPAMAEPARDGSHDFDFANGVWHTHAIQIGDPFDGGTHTTVYDGAKTARAVWGGKGWMEEIEADAPGGDHWEGMTLFLYNPKSGQWSQSYAGGSDGQVGAPTIGSFKDGRGEFYGVETYKGRQVLTRGVWSDITPNSHRFVISLSEDGGQTWVTAFKADLTRIK